MKSIPKREISRRFCVLLVGFQLAGCGFLSSEEFNTQEKSYLRAVELISAKTISPPESVTLLPNFEATPPKVKRIFAKRRSDGTLVVEFFRYGRFPVRHAGFLYDQSDHPELDPSVRKRWRKCTRLKENWFYFAD